MSQYAATLLKHLRFQLSLQKCHSDWRCHRSAIGRVFDKLGPAAEKLLSPSRMRVLRPTHVKESADSSDRRPISATSWQSSRRYSHCGSRLCTALFTRTANLNCRTGNQCSWRRIAVMCMSSNSSDQSGSRVLNRLESL